jgi:hypothetical protein
MKLMVKKKKKEEEKKKKLFVRARARDGHWGAAAAWRGEPRGKGLFRSQHCDTGRFTLARQDGGCALAGSEPAWRGGGGGGGGWRGRIGLPGSASGHRRERAKVALDGGPHTRRGH